MSVSFGRILSVSIVVCWAAILAAHVWKTRAPAAVASIVDISPASGAELTQRGIFYRGARIGFMREQITPRDGGTHAEQQGELTVNVMGDKRTMEITGSADLSTTGKLTGFAFRLATTSGYSSFETEVRGRIEGKELDLRVRSGDQERSESRLLREPIVVPIHLYHTLAAQGLEPGLAYRLRLFDPLTLGEGEAEITVLEPEVVRWGGREEEAFRLRTRFSGLTTTAWVNRDGELLKEETALGWTLLKEVPGTSLRAGEAGNLPEVIGASAVPALGFAGEPSKLKRARLRLNNFPVLDETAQGGRQRVSGNEVFIEVESLPPPPSAPLSQEERLQALASDPFIQADDPEIRSLALRLTGGMSVLKAARSLSEWVHQNLRKTPTLSVPSAREVLEQRAGDCNEHTVLFTALARAAGIPARICTGLAWSSGQFYYHAWPEIWAGAWVAVDPTFGQFPADPLHIRLLVGGLEKQYEVLKLLGRGSTIEVVEAE